MGSITLIESYIDEEPTFVRHRRLSNMLFNHGLLTRTSFLTMPPIACGARAPAAPSRMKERSNPFGPVIFISHRSFAWEPMIETHPRPIRKHVLYDRNHIRPKNRISGMHFHDHCHVTRENITDALEAAMARADLDRIVTFERSHVDLPCLK
jgi:hypothetical protein